MSLRSLYLDLTLMTVINESLQSSILLFFKTRHKSGTKLCRLFIVYMATKRNYVVIRHKCILWK